MAALLALPCPAVAADRNFSVTDFDSVRVQGPYSVTIVTARSTTARASGSAEALDSLTLSVVGRTLTIRPRMGGGWGERGEKGGKAATIRITTPTLKLASLGGSGSLTVSGLKALKADLVLSGSGQLVANGIAADRLALSVVGSGSATLSGRAQVFDVTVSGSAGLLADQLPVLDLKLTAQTSGAIAARADRKAVVVSTGAGAVAITGRGACTVTAIGTGEVRCGDSAR